MTKEQFILSEIWNLTLAGAFQRANIYQKGIKEKQKVDFKNKLHELVLDIAKQYKIEVIDKNHLNNIYLISQLIHNALQNGNLNFGISQKVLNLYLKYLWCLERIPTPPHFPVDRIIQKELRIKKIVSWTQMKNEKDYMRIIEHAKLKAQEQNISPSQLELNLYSRRNNK